VILIVYLLVIIEK